MYVKCLDPNESEINGEIYANSNLERDIFPDSDDSEQNMISSQNNACDSSVYDLVDAGETTWLSAVEPTQIWHHKWGRY
jgi:hypothetical protein